MADIFDQLFNKRRNRSSASSDGSNSSPEPKKSKQNSPSPNQHSIEEEAEKDADSVDMSDEIGAKLQAILAKLEKLDTIESTLKTIQEKLENLEARTQKLEHFRTRAEKDIGELKDGANFAEQQLQEKLLAFGKSQQEREAQLKDLAEKFQKSQDAVNEIHTKNLYLESYSRRENLKFMNIDEDELNGGKNEDTEEVLRCFLERELGFMDARRVEFQRVHCIGKSREGKPRPILARFLRFKDCQQILSLGHRLKDTDFQIYKDLPQEIISRRKLQMESFKAAKRSGVPASFSTSQPDKLFIRGKLWPVGVKFIN